MGGMPTCRCFASCASCHGSDGRSPTAVGRAMYPPAPALDSPHVQNYTDPQLFWVIKNGIRLTGMPGYGDLFSDEQIWDLVYFVRQTGKSPTKAER